MNAAVYAKNSQLHLAPPPETPPPGRRYLGADEELRAGDKVWDGVEEHWLQASSLLAGAEAHHFTRVSRLDPTVPPPAPRRTKRATGPRPKDGRAGAPRLSRTLAS